MASAKKTGYDQHCSDNIDPIGLEPFKDIDEVIVINLGWTKEKIGKSQCYLRSTLCEYFRNVASSTYRLPLGGYIDAESADLICKSDNAVFASYGVSNSDKGQIHKLKFVDPILFWDKNKIEFEQEEKIYDYQYENKDDYQYENKDDYQSDNEESDSEESDEGFFVVNNEYEDEQKGYQVIVRKFGFFIKDLDSNEEEYIGPSNIIGKHTLYMEDYPMRVPRDIYDRDRWFRDRFPNALRFRK